jgi:hypothetical protein
VKDAFHRSGEPLRHPKAPPKSKDKVEFFSKLLSRIDFPAVMTRRKAVPFQKRIQTGPLQRSTKGGVISLPFVRPDSYRTGAHAAAMDAGLFAFLYATLHFTPP